MSQGRVDRQPAYVLHAQPYRETSLLLDVLTREHGRIALVARGARRPRSDLRGVLLPFQPLLLAWFGKSEVRTLHTADWQGGVPQLSGLPLVCGFYLNELLIKLTARDDPHPETFGVYAEAVRGLASGGLLSSVLRRFELGLVRTLGYAPAFDVDSNGREVEPDVPYLCGPEQALQRWQGGPVPAQQQVIEGRILLAMAGGDFSELATRREARRLMRLFLGQLLGAQSLATRELLQSISALGD
ncbi:DNA repair protein RecO [Pseudogulbenkiania ferrooxidans]|uniref:DNA repair protein RecO n=1 Tax=Pseudogulbenkiania ferrooxidans 2002 TaxID=279714 RepID=B9Z298_9NEIS|nr:DNA repair protein RecO [Pseudogulbenkiania ferrooxidans]EEG09074.1 DNA repair protein RecO [Pseudogulbenkiania ferrooxidans 2002]